jgi:Lecithin retinol acyltransferase
MHFTELVSSNGEPIGPGDWVRVFVPRLGVWHHGIVRQVAYLTAGLFAVEVAHNMKLTGITVTDLIEFADGQPVFLHRRPLPNQIPEILARVDANMGRPYHLFAQNCEHFASFAFTGKADSTSVKTAGVLTAAIIIGFLGS